MDKLPTSTGATAGFLPSTVCSHAFTAFPWLPPLKLSKNVSFIAEKHSRGVSTSGPWPLCKNGTSCELCPQGVIKWDLLWGDFPCNQWQCIVWVGVILWPLVFWKDLHETPTYTPSSSNIRMGKASILEGNLHTSSNVSFSIEMLVLPECVYI